MRRILSVSVSMLAALFAAQACTVRQTGAPSLTGPSEFALSVGISATPDSLVRDGGSQSSIAVVIRDADARPVANQVVRVDMSVSGSVQDFGTLSARTLVTGADGIARVVYTAPSAPSPGVTATPVIVSIVATPFGTNAQALQSQSVDIRLMPLGVILPTGPAPTPQIVFAPTSPSAASPVGFDGSTSCGGPLTAAGLCPGSAPAIASYSWNFGDGSTATGAVVSHTFLVQQTYSVTLTITNEFGVSASRTQALNVGAGVLPTGTFTFSPTPVNVNDTVHFSAEGIRPGPGRTIVQFSWNFGDGGTGSGFLVDHAFIASGAYVVTLSVRDDANQGATFTNTVNVGTGNPTAVLTINKAGGNSIIGDGSASTAVGSATITNYRFAWGDGNTDSGTAAVVNHTYAGAGTFTVRLTVTDSLGRTGTVTQQVTVP